METVSCTIGGFARRSRSVVLPHSQTQLTRGLEPGERIVVQDGDFRWIGTVADLHFTLTDTEYRIELGPRVEAEDLDAGFGDGSLHALLSALRSAPVARSLGRVAGTRA